MTKISLIRWILLAFIGISLVACGGGKQRIRIGFSQCTGGEWREQMNQEILSEAGFYDHVDIAIRNASGSIGQQIEDIQFFIREHVDLLIVSPLEDSALIETFNNLDFHNIPVLLVDRKLSSNKYVSFVGASNWEVGTKAAEYVKLLRGEKTTHILHIKGHDKSTATLERESAFVNVLYPLKNMTVSTLVSGDDYGGKNVESTKHILEDNLDLLKTVDVIYAFNDAIAITAYEVLRKEQIQPIPLIIGVDGLLGYNKGIYAVKEGILTASIVYPTGGRKVLDVGMKIVNHVSVPKENLLPTFLIDKHNVSVYYNQGLDVTELQQKINFLLEEKKTDKRWLRIYVSGGLLGVVVLFIIAGAFLFRKVRNTRIEGGEKPGYGGEKDAATSVSAESEAFEMKVSSYVKAHYMEYDCDLSVLMDEFKLSRVHFYKKFKLKFGDTPNNYLKKYRLEKSKGLILSNKYTYAEVGYQVGFSSPAYFTKCFKEEYSLTPSQYFDKKTKKSNRTASGASGE